MNYIDFLLKERKEALKQGDGQKVREIDNALSEIEI